MNRKIKVLLVALVVLINAAVFAFAQEQGNATTTAAGEQTKNALQGTSGTQEGTKAKDKTKSHGKHKKGGKKPKGKGHKEKKEDKQ